MISRRLATLFLGFLTLIPAWAAGAGAAVPPPNILFIMSDDHAAHALSCYGSQVNQTPGLDRIAQGGMRFENAFVTNSICTPSRATLLTGKYSHQNGSPVFNRFDGSQPHVARLLQSAGYHTAMIGMQITRQFCSLPDWPRQNPGGGFHPGGRASCG
jgi:hypothetical protein